jgi:hypothetical protein
LQSHRLAADGAIVSPGLHVADAVEGVGCFQVPESDVFVFATIVLVADLVCRFTFAENSGLVAEEGDADVGGH